MVSPIQFLQRHSAIFVPLIELLRETRIVSGFKT